MSTSDEKFPRSLSSVQYSDIKQIQSILRKTSDAKPSELEVEDFLTNLGANLFAAGKNTKRVQSASSISSSQRSSKQEETKVENNDFVFKTKQKETTVHGRHTAITFNLPSQIKSLRLPSLQPAQPKKNITAYRMHKMLYTQEKHEQVLQSLKDMKEKKFEQAMLKQELRDVCSQRKRKEAELKRKSTKERLEWHFLEKRKILSEVKILIIGGGMAGLSAADRLFALGYRNVKILEASNR